MLRLLNTGNESAYGKQYEKAELHSDMMGTAIRSIDVGKKNMKRKLYNIIWH